MEMVKAVNINGEFAVALCGHVDSVNAAEVEAAINELLQANPGEALTIDADELSYISSAGLRIILRLMKSGRKLKMINASPEVYEIMETTGFSEMMPVQKAYRRISVEGCEIIGKGANGSVYRLDPERIVKVYRNANALNEMSHEREIARRAFILGIPTAIPYDIVRVGDSYGAVFELLNADSITKLVARDPQNIDRYVGMFVDLLKQIHATETKPGLLPDMKAIAVKWARFLEGHIPDDQFKKLCALVEAVPEDLHLMHGDYHSNNVLVQNGEALLIDMDTVCCGNPVFEIASVFNAFIGFSEADPETSGKFLGISAELSRMIFEKSMRLYFNTDDEAKLQEYVDKAMVVGYTRLLRRTLRREADTELGKRRIALCKAHLAELLPRVDTLLF